MQKILPTLLLPLLLLPACAPKAKPIPYPDSFAGEKARAFYNNPTSIENYNNLRERQLVADRTALTPTLLAIIDENANPRSLFAAYILSEWNPKLAASSPQFQKIAPLAAQTLNAPNDPTSNSLQWSALSSAYLLSRMGPTVISTHQKPIAERFLAPADQPILGESPEWWTRYTLAACLVFVGPDGIPPLTQGLSHPNPFVRTIALGALAAPARFDSYSDQQKERYPYNPALKAPTLAAARKTIPEIVNTLWDPEESVRLQACRTLAALAQPSDATPRLLTRLQELQTNHPIEPTAALQKLHAPQ